VPSSCLALLLLSGNQHQGLNPPIRVPGLGIPNHQCTTSAVSHDPSELDEPNRDGKGFKQANGAVEVLGPSVLPGQLTRSGRAQVSARRPLKRRSTDSAISMRQTRT
jgi:hypothetical protein